MGTSVRCAGCSAGFTFLDKGHLCRSCGETFCAKCSNGRCPVPEKGHREPVRVCDVCLHARESQNIRGDTQGNESGVWGDEQARSEREKNLKVMAALRTIYKAKVRPLEKSYHFSEFYASEMNDGDFDARPMVLLVGQYSVGKTSFVRYLLERDFPGGRIGPEPTTDRFLAVMAGRPDMQECVVPGNAAAVDVNRPFTSLTKFGTAFLNKFEVSEMASPILDSISFIDTPGILSGDKQRIERGYDFEEVVQWFAERADRILVLFDAHKLDISDELKRVIEVLKSHDDKIRIVLNKADMVDPQQLMRVYGALMWSLGKVIRSPEVLRVYIGSFWDKPLNPTGAGNSNLFEAEKADLLNDLRTLPRNAAVRKINELVKRARLAKVHALLLSHLRSSMPYMWGHKEKQARLATRLTQEYAKVQRAHNLAIGDFPPVEKVRSGLSAFNLADFGNLSKRQTDIIDIALSRDIPKLMMSVGGPRNDAGTTESVNDAKNPFEEGRSRFDDANNVNGEAWAVTPKVKAKWDEMFLKLNPCGEPPALTGLAVKGLMLNSGLSPDCLKKIWELGDVDQDGKLDEYEFALTMHLVKIARDEGAGSIPDVLPLSFVPPCKR